MGELPDVRRLKIESLEVQSDFVRNELNLAQTFCDAAFTAGQDARARRNLEYALHAWAAASRFAEHVRAKGGIFPKEVTDQLHNVGKQVEQLARRFYADFD